MTKSLRLSAVAVALVLPALLLARWTFATTSFRDAEVVLSLPDAIGPWTKVEDSELDEEVLEAIEPDDYLMRRYEAPGRPPVWVFVSIYARGVGQGKAAHDPEICYPAQGWEIMASQGVTIPVNDSESLEAKQLETHNGVLEEQVLYWFQPADRWQRSYTAEQLTQVIDAVRGRPQYAFVRLSVSGGEEAAEELRALAPALAVRVRENVDRL